MPQSNYSRFSDGVQISGVSMNVHQKGKVFYVCNSTVPSALGIAGSDGSDGKTPDRPLATIAQALSLCTANRGDKIIVMQGHAETVSAAAGMAWNVAGVSIIGDPTAVGSLRPTITLNTANTATIAMSAANMVVSGILFIANFLNIAACIDVSAKDILISGNEFRDTSAVLNFVLPIRTSTGADNACDGLSVIGNRFLGVGTTAATSLVNCRSITGRLTVNANSVDIQGTTATSGALVLATSKALTGARILGNDLASNLSTSNAGQLVVAGTGGSGFVADNYVQSAGGTDLLGTASSGLTYFNNFLSAVADASGYILPAQDA